MSERELMEGNIPFEFSKLGEYISHLTGTYVLSSKSFLHVKYVLLFFTRVQNLVLKLAPHLSST
jgi:hypothetical protein